MRGLAVFLQKEFVEIVKTWRIWVLPGMVLLFALTSPLVALLTPMLVASLAGSETGVVIQMPDPTAVDAYGQFLKNLNQIVLIGIVITSAGAVSGERKSGTAALMLTKPLSRTAFLLAKVVSQYALLVVTTIVGAGICVGVTAMMFESASPAPFFQAVLLWLLFALLMVVVMTFLSVVIRAQAGAAGVGLGLFFITAIVANWEPIATYTFAGLGPASGKVLRGIEVQFAWPIATALLAGAAIVTASVVIFRRVEL